MQNNINSYNCLICCSNNEDATVFANLFLKNGYISTIINNPDQVISLLKDDNQTKSKFKFFVIGLDFSDNKSYKLLDCINEIYFNDDDKKLPIIITISMFLSKEKINLLQTKHVVRFYNRPVSAQRLDYDLSLLFFKFQELLPPKNNIIVETTEQELLRGNCNYYDGRHISVKILDVSLVGIHVECYDEQLLAEILTGEHDFIEHFIFEANDMIIERLLSNKIFPPDIAPAKLKPNIKATKTPTKSKTAFAIKK